MTSQSFPEASPASLSRTREPLIAGTSATEADAGLCSSLRALQRAEHHAVLWFAEIMNRRLYEELGYSSMHHYATERLGFSRSRTGYFVRLARRMKELKHVRAAMARGDLPWTKASEVVKVATPRTEKLWIETARSTGRRDLAREVKRARARSRRRTRGPDLFATAARPGVVPGVALGGKADTAPHAAVALSAETEATHTSTADTGAAHSMTADTEPTSSMSADTCPPGSGTTDFVTAEVPETASLTMTPAEFARYETLLDKLRTGGMRGSAVSLILAALEAQVLAASRLASPNRPADMAVPKVPRDNPGPAYQVYVRHCEDCDRGWVETSRGPKLLDHATLRSILCDARVSRPGKPNRSQVPPRLRREVLDRDRHRCRVRGCGSSRFLAVHHLKPRGDGGRNRLSNLVTLCEPCHRLLHRLRGSELSLTRPRDMN